MDIFIVTICGDQGEGARAFTSYDDAVKFVHDEAMTRWADSFERDYGFGKDILSKAIYETLDATPYLFNLSSGLMRIPCYNKIFRQENKCLESSWWGIYRDVIN